MTSSLKNQATKGMFWALGERFATQGTLFVVSLILARLLSPNDYGQVSLLLVFITLADVFVTNGISEAIIQKKDPSDEDYFSLLLCGLLLSIFLYLAIYFCAPIIAHLYKNNDMILLLRILAMRIPLSSLNAIQKAFISKNFLFQRQFIGSFFGSLVSGAIAIFAAYNGFGVYSLIVQQLLSVLLTTLFLSYLLKWNPICKFSYNACKELLPLGMQFSFASFINVLYDQFRSLLIGIFYTPSDLALFNKGNQFPSLIIGNLSVPICNVFLPVIVEVRSCKDRLRKVFSNAIQITSYVTFPFMSYMFLTAPELVEFLLGSQWSGCVPFLRLGCLFFSFQPLQSINWQVLKGLGQGTLCFSLEIIKKVIGFTLVILSIPYGVGAIALSSTLFGCISMIINMIPNKEFANYSVLDQIKDICMPLIVSVCAGFPLIIYHWVNFHGLCFLASSFLLYFISFLLVSKVLNVYPFLYLVKYIKKQIK